MENDLVLFGGGFLYILESLHSLLENQLKVLTGIRIFVYEPIPEIKTHNSMVSRREEWIHKFKNLGIEILFPDHVEEIPPSYSSSPTPSHADSFMDSHSSHDSRGLFLYPLPFYARNFPGEWENFKNKCTPPIQKHNQVSLDQNTIDHFSKIWTSEILKTHLDRTINLLTPAIRSEDSRVFLFLGAGPSLEDDISLIERHRDKFFIISSDTAFSFIQERSISPDGILNVDPGRGSIYHLMDSQESGIPFFTWMGGCPRNRLFPNSSKLPQNANNTIKYFLTTHPLDQFLAECWGLDDTIILENPSRNLAGMALSLAKFWGFTEVVFSGVGFLAEGDKTHCRGTGYEKFYLPQVSRRSRLESLYPRKAYGLQLTNKNLIAKEALSVYASSNQMKLSTFSDWIACSSDEINSYSEHKTNEDPTPRWEKFSPPSLEKSLPPEWGKLLQNYVLTREIPGIDNQTLRRFIPRIMQSFA